MELQREKAVEYIIPAASVLQPQTTQFAGITNETQTDVLRRMEMCAIKLKREMQRGITKAKAEENAEVATAIARMAKGVNNDIDINTKGSIDLDLPPKFDEAQINDSSVSF